MDLIHHQPEMLGGSRVAKYALPNGNSAGYPPIQELAELKAMGGKINRGKKAKKHTAFAFDVVNKGLDLAKAVGGKVSRGKKAKKHSAFALDLANKGLDLASKMAGGKVNRLKKAKRWTGFAEDVIKRAIPLGKEIGEMVGKGKAKRAPSARAVIVKKVMKDKGLSMIEASKYVKANNMY